MKNIKFGPEIDELYDDLNTTDLITFVVIPVTVITMLINPSYAPYSLFGSLTLCML